MTTGSAGTGTGKPSAGPYLSRAWELVKGDPVTFIVGYLVVAILAGIPCVGLIIGGPLVFGFVRMVQKKIKGEPASIGDVFQGFQQFGKGLVTFLLCAVLFFVVCIPAIILALIPYIGIFLAIPLYLVGIAVGLSVMLFTVPPAALSEVQPVDAIKNAFTFLKANPGLPLVIALVAIAGGLACGIGVLLTAPIAWTAAVLVYNEQTASGAAK